MKSLNNAKIAFVTLQGYNAFAGDTGQPQGGAEIQQAQLARLLNEKFSCSIRFICLAQGEERLENFDGIEVQTISRGTGNFAKMQGVFARLQEFQPDIVLQRCWGIETWMAARYARKHGAKFVFMLASMQDVAPLTFRDRLHWRKNLYKRGLYSADTIVAQSRDQQQLLKENHRLDSLLLRSIQPPPEPTNFANKKSVLWVGRAVEIKQPQLMLDIAEYFPGIPFTMILNASHLQEFSDAQIARAHALPNVEHVPFVPYDEIMRYFHEARMVVNTSKEEGFPNTFLQAYRASTPVFSLSADPDSLVYDNGLGFVACGDINTLANEIKLLYNDTDWIEATGKKCAAHLLREHNREKIIEQWSELLSDLLC